MSTTLKRPSGIPDPATASSTAQFSRREIAVTMAGVLLVLLLASLDQTIVGTALPRVIVDLHGFDRYTWVATAYLLTETLSIPIYGKLSDLLGRKAVLLWGIVVFLTGSALSGAAPTMNALIAFRALQGLGGGALQPIARAVTGDLFSPRERGKWQGITGAVFGLSSIIGPGLGGLITDHTSWRWVFYINLPVGIGAFVVLAFLMPRLRPPHGRVAIDYLGAALLIAGTAPLLYGLTLAGSDGWRSRQVIALLAGSAILLLLFTLYEAWVERRGGEPILAPSLFTQSARIFGVSVLVSAIVGMGIFSSAFFIPLFVQGVLGTSATSSGVILTPLMVAAIVGAIASGQILTRTGRYKLVAAGGVLIACAGAFLLTRLSVHSANGDVVIAMIVLGLGVGSGLSVYTTIVQNALPGRLGQATAALTFFQQIGGTLGLAAMGSVLSAAYAPAFHAALPSGLAQRLPGPYLALFDNPQALLSPSLLAQLHTAAAASGPAAVAALDAILGAVRSGLADSLHDVFVVALGLMLAGLVCVLLLREIPLRDRRDTVTP